MAKTSVRRSFFARLSMTLRRSWWCRHRSAALLCSLAALSLVADAEAKIFLTVPEALELAFPGCEVTRETVFLTAEQQHRASELAELEIESKLVYPYLAICAGEFAGAAYFDSHRVRTLPETVMIVVDAEARIRRIEVIEFREPEDYIPRLVWYQQFDSKALDRELELERSIRGVTGATLTARATTDAARRVLAVHQVIATGWQGDRPGAEQQ